MIRFVFQKDHVTNNVISGLEMRLVGGRQDRELLRQSRERINGPRKPGRGREKGSERKRAIDCEDCRNGSAFWFGWLTGEKSVTANHRKAGLGVFVT